MTRATWWATRRLTPVWPWRQRRMVCRETPRSAARVVSFTAPSSSQRRSTTSYRSRHVPVVLLVAPADVTGMFQTLRRPGLEHNCYRFIRTDDFQQVVRAATVPGMQQLRQWRFDPRHPPTTMSHRRYREQRRDRRRMLLRRWSAKMSHVRNTGDRSSGNWAAYVRSHREVAGMSQGALASKIEVTRQTINRWESGRYRPDSADHVVRFAHVVGVDPSDALVAAGFLPEAIAEIGARERRRVAARESASPIEPDVDRLRERLADPDASPEEKAMLRTMIQYALEVGRLARNESEHPDRREEAG